MSFLLLLIPFVNPILRLPGFLTGYVRRPARNVLKSTHLESKVDCR